MHNDDERSTGKETQTLMTGVSGQAQLPHPTTIASVYQTTLDQTMIHQQQQQQQQQQQYTQYPNQNTYQYHTYQVGSDHIHHHHRQHDYDDANIPELWQDGFDMEGVDATDDCSICCFCCICRCFSVMFYCLTAVIQSPKFESFRRGMSL